MLNEKDIKPVPKYIIKLIQSKDKIRFECQPNYTRFYSYFTKIKRKISLVIVAVKNRYKKWYFKQVAVHTIGEEFCLVKDIAYYYIAGYVVGWYEEGLSTYKRNYENGWEQAYEKYFYPYAQCVNKDYVLKIDKYKYSAIDKFHVDNPMKYLKVYEKYPQAEILIKLGLGNYAMSITILRQVAKDKKFRTWILANKDTLKVRDYYVNTILLAYKNNWDLKTAERFDQYRKALISSDCYQEVLNIFKKEELHKFFEYADKQHLSFSSYKDYLEACNALKIDMSLSKNNMPRNFEYWHDVRIDQYKTMLEKENAKKKREFAKTFINISKKYLSLQRNLKEAFAVIIPKAPKDLVLEGNTLHHCVGKMNYDQKFAREESLIFFVRNKENIDTPFVTIEYSLKSKKVLQCYGHDNTKPDTQVLSFVYKTWLPYANRKLRKLQSLCA